jgi:hypothetical protein
VTVMAACYRPSSLLIATVWGERGSASGWLIAPTGFVLEPQGRGSSVPCKTPDLSLFLDTFVSLAGAYGVDMPRTAGEIRLYPR